jgi:predicted Kef-type K+ transport protein
MPDTDEARQFAEYGIVFLMFSIGLEFSLPKLFSMKRLVFGLGATQVGQPAGCDRLRLAVRAGAERVRLPSALRLPCRPLRC